MKEISPGLERSDYPGFQNQKHLSLCRRRERSEFSVFAALLPFATTV
jgi:hypothetical protein